jgi:hypothetical protein
VKEGLSFEEDIRRRKVVSWFEGGAKISDMLLPCGKRYTLRQWDFGAISDGSWPCCCEQNIGRICTMESFGITNSMKRQILFL